ncbi:transglutaminase domain-containing protein [Flavobacterium artemisiae]
MLKSNAQDSKFGTITITALEEKVHPQDSAAVGAVLFSHVKMNLKMNGSTEKVTRKKVKIYKNGGYNLSNIQFYCPAGKSNNVEIVNAATYNLVDGKIVKTKLTSESEFVEKTNNDFWIKKITFPNVKEGSIIEYECKEWGGYLSDWSFQENIPVNYSELVTIIPDPYVFKKNIKGIYTPKVISKVANTYGYSAIETSYLFQNLPAMKEESYVNNINNYRSGISFELESVAIPGQFYKSFSNDWTNVAKTIYDFDNFGPELNKTGYFEDDLKKLLEGKNTSNAKITAILDYVKSTVTWNDYVGYSCAKGVRKAYKDKSGNCADINLMLTAMLRHAGLKANPVLTSTRSNGIAFFPTLSAFNYVIAAVENGDELILLDATDKYSAPNVLPLRALNWFGRLIRKDGTSESIDLAPKKTSLDNITVDYAIEANGQISGKVRHQFTEYNAMAFRNKFEKAKKDNYLDSLEEELGKIEIRDYSQININDILLSPVEIFSFSGTDLCELIGDKIYINPMLFFASTKNPFKQDKREYPIDFGFPFLEKYNINIRIPDGFVLETIPSANALVMEEGLGTFKYNIAVNENMLQLLIIHQINVPIVTTDQYGIIREYYKEMIAKQTQKIVLKKI